LPKSRESSEGVQLWAIEIENSKRDVQELAIQILKHLATRTNPNAAPFSLRLSMCHHGKPNTLARPTMQKILERIMQQANWWVRMIFQY
jgi:hypothetical protein